MSAKGILGAALIVTSLCLAGGGIYAMHRLKQKTADPETLCPFEGSKTVTLILIDKTDPLTAAEQAAVHVLVNKEAVAVQRGDRISVKILQQKQGTSETALETAADLCNPGEEANPLFENPKRVAARYQNAFQEPIGEALARVSGAGSASISSPIASAIGEAGAGPASPNQHLKLILVSDLMEHTQGASAYSGTLSEEALRKAIPASTLAKLKGADIRVLLLGRPRYARQQNTAIAIWRRFFEATSGREPEMTRP